ncbi:hypothetical protein [Arcobacter sp.]|uniref:hypothetical protein n=1 Tax=Arcobacter sp. TaxID=1872629 RepID=UPI003D12B935
MTNEQIMTSLFGFSGPTYYKWSKKERNERPIFNLLGKYFTKEELEEFLETGKIDKLENMKYIKNQFLLVNMDNYIRDFNDNSLKSSNFLIQDFFFFFLKNKNELLKNGFHNEYTFIKSITQYVYNDFCEEFENIYKEEIFSFSELLGTDETENNDELTKSRLAISDTFEKKDEKFNDILRCLYFAQFWSKDMDTFLNIVIKDEFEFFINSGNDELLYHSIGFLVYSNDKTRSLPISIKDKLDIVSKTFKYFTYKNELINLNNIKNHILLRISNPLESKKFDDEIEKYEEIIKEKELEKIRKKLMKPIKPIKLDIQKKK